MKMPEPMIPLMTIIVASNRVRRRANPGLGASPMCSPLGWKRGGSLLQRQHPGLAAGEDEVRREEEVRSREGEPLRGRGDWPRREIRQQAGSSGSAVARPELVAVDAVVGGEPDLAAHGGEEVREGRSGPRRDIPDQDRAAGSAVRAPELEAMGGIPAAEKETRAEPGPLRRAIDAENELQRL